MMNLKSIAQQSQADTEKKRIEFLMRKYGPNNFDPSKAWGMQTGQVLANWSDLDEQNALAQMNMMNANQVDANAMRDKYQNIITNQNQGLAQAGVNQQLLQKYMGNEIRESGMQGQGIAQSIMAGIGNQYVNNMGKINLAAAGQVNDAYNTYKDAITTRQQNLDAETADNNVAYQSTQMQKALEEINALNTNGQLTKESFDAIKKKYTDLDVNPNNFNDVESYYQQTFKDQYYKAAGVDQNDAGFDIANTSVDQLKSNFKYFGSNIKDSAQNVFVTNVLNDIKTNISNYEGKVVDLNLGYGNDYYKIMNGRLYKFTGDVNSNNKVDLTRFKDEAQKHQKDTVDKYVNTAGRWIGDTAKKVTKVVNKVVKKAK